MPEGTLSLTGMVGVGFFWVSGGLYGNELLVSAAPPGVVLLFLIVVACTYAIPSALVSAELSTSIPEDGGAIVWAERAFGFSFAMHNAWWTYCSFIFDVSLYPVLTGDYVLKGGLLSCPNYDNVTCPVVQAMSGHCPVKPGTLSPGASDQCAFPFEYNDKTYTHCTDVDGAGNFWCETTVTGTWADCLMNDPINNCTDVDFGVPDALGDAGGYINVDRSLFAMAMVLCITLLKLKGMDLIVKLSTVMSVLSLLPCIVWVGGSMGSLDWTEITRMDGQPIRWSLLFSFVLWLNIGWVGLGALAGQVENPAKTYPPACLILFVVSCLVNVVPIMVAVSLHDTTCDPTMTMFEPGFFGILAGQKFGCWLQISFKIGALLANIGLYNAQILLAEFTMVYLMEKLFPEWSKKKEDSGEWLWTKMDGIAPFHTLFNGALCMVVVWIPASSLVECSSFLGALTILVVMAAFVRLRIIEETMERPYKLPVNSLTGLGLILLVPCIIGILTIVMNIVPPAEVKGTSPEDVLFDEISYAVRVGVGGMTILIGIIFMSGLKAGMQYARYLIAENEPDPDDDGIATTHNPMDSAVLGDKVAPAF